MLKIVYLILKNFKKFITTQTAVFLVIFISQAISSAAFMYFYSLNLDNYREYEKYSYITRTYNIMFTENDSVSEKYKLIRELDYELTLPQKLQCIVMHANKADNIIISGCYSNIEKIYLIEGRMFTEEEQKSDADIAIIGDSFLNYHEKLTYTGEYFNLEDIKYKIRGVFDDTPSNTIFIPYNTFFKNSYNVNSIQVSYSRRLSTSEESIIKEKVNSICPSAKIEFPPRINKGRAAEFFFKMAIYMILIWFTIISIISLYRFWFVSNKDQYVIFRICGAYKRTVIHLVAFECLFITLISFVFGILLYLSIMPLLKSLEIYYEIGAFGFILSFFVIFLCTLTGVIPTALKISKIAPVQKLQIGG